MKTSISLLLIILTCLFCSCDNSSDDSSSPAATIDLTGTWYRVKTSQGGAPIVTVTLTYTATTCTRVESVYAPYDPSIHLLDITFESTYAVTGTLTATHLYGNMTTAFKIDKTYTSITATPKSEAGVQSSNDVVAFGISNWQLNQSEDISGMTNEDTSEVYPEVGDILYDIHKKESIGEEYTLFIGNTTIDGNDGSSNATRPTYLSGAAYAEQVK